MRIDCHTCVARHTTACDDCIVAVLCDEDRTMELDRDEWSAIETMSDAGLISPIRLVTPADREPREEGRASG